MSRAYLSRRKFLQQTGIAEGALLVDAGTILAQGQAKRTATDQVALGVERTPPPNVAPVVASEPVQVVLKQPEFPSLKLSVVILGGSRSCAIINSKTVESGETIEGVRLVAIRENTVVVEFQGFQKTISRFASLGVNVKQKGVLR